MDTILVTTESQLKKIIKEVVDDALKVERQTTYIESGIDTYPFGDLKWLYSIWPRSENTIEQMSAKGVIPGKIKVGKSVMYEKATVLAWLRRHKCEVPTYDELQLSANSQYEKQQYKLNHNRRSKKFSTDPNVQESDNSGN